MLNSTIQHQATPSVCQSAFLKLSTPTFTAISAGSLTARFIIQYDIYYSVRHLLPQTNTAEESHSLALC